MYDMDSQDAAAANKSRRDKMRRIVSRAIVEELTERQRQVFLAYHQKQMTIPEIAGVLGVNKSTISRTLARAEERIRRITKYF